MTIENNVDSPQDFGHTDESLETTLSLDDIISNELDNTVENEDNTIEASDNDNANAKTSTVQGSPKPGQKAAQKAMPKPAKGNVAIGAAKTTGTPAQQAPVQSVQVENLEAPARWPEDRKAVFNSLPEHARKAWLDQAKDYERGFSEQGAKFAAAKKYHDEMEQVLNNNWVNNELKNRFQGMSKPQAVKNLVQLYYGIMTDPIGHIKFIASEAQKRGYDVSGLFNGQSPNVANQNGQQPQGQNPVRDAALLAVNNELRRLKSDQGYVNQVIGQVMKQKGHNDTINFISNMQSAVGETGEKMYPHMDDALMEQMTQIITSNPTLQAEKNVALKLDMAYKLALAQNYNQFVQQGVDGRMQQVNNGRTAAAKPAKPGPGSNVRTRNKKPGLDNILDDVFDQFGLGN